MTSMTVTGSSITSRTLIARSIKWLRFDGIAIALPRLRPMVDHAGGCEGSFTRPIKSAGTEAPSFIAMGGLRRSLWVIGRWLSLLQTHSGVRS